MIEIIRRIINVDYRIGRLIMISRQMGSRVLCSNDSN